MAQGSGICRATVGNGKKEDKFGMRQVSSSRDLSLSNRISVLDFPNFSLSDRSDRRRDLASKRTDL